MIAEPAAFGAGSVVHAASSSEIAATMVVSGDTSMMAPDCKACIEGEVAGVGRACDLFCAANGVAAVPVLQAHGFAPLRR